MYVLHTGLEVAYLGIGSNLGDRDGAISRSLGQLAKDRGILSVRVSPIYETEAHVLEGDEASPYLNLVAAVETSLVVGDLFKVCQRLERTAGRVRGSISWQPRVLDIDLLLFGEHSLRSQRLTVPHPRMLERKFVLRPLFDLNPTLKLPSPFNKSLKEALQQCPDMHAVERWGTDE